MVGLGVHRVRTVEMELESVWCGWSASGRLFGSRNYVLVHRTCPQQRDQSPECQSYCILTCRVELERARRREGGGRWAAERGARRETREQGPGSEVEPGVQQIPARPHMMSLFFSRKTQGRTGTLTAVGRRTRDARGKWRQRARGRTPALLRYPSHFPCATQRRQEAS